MFEKQGRYCRNLSVEHENTRLFMRGSEFLVSNPALRAGLEMADFGSATLSSPHDQNLHHRPVIQMDGADKKNGVCITAPQDQGADPEVSIKNDELRIHSNP